MKTSISIWFKGLRLKMLGLSIIPLIGFFVIFITANTGTNDLSKLAINSVTNTSEVIDKSGQLSGSAHALGRWMWITYGLEGDKISQDKFILKAENEIKSVDSNIELFMKLKKNGEITKNFNEMLAYWKVAREATNEIIVYFKNHTPEDTLKAKEIMKNKFVKNLVPMTEKLSLISKEVDKIQSRELEETELAVRNVKRNLILASSIFGSLIFIMSIIFAHKSSSELSSVSENLRDLSLKVKDASTQLTGSATSLSQAGTEQASSLQETAASVEELSNIVDKNASDATRSAQIAKETVSVAKAGQVVLEELVSKIDDINESNNKFSDQSKQAFKKIESLVELIEEIQRKTSVINDIVFQTKLLSFNASVEAARAGEQGKGFAVVAEEVGNLAAMSGEAASSISALLSNSSSEVKKIVEESISDINRMINESTDQAESGKEIAKKCTELFEKILTEVETVTSSADSIAYGSTEQAVGIREINKALLQLDQVTHENANNAECSSQIAKNLNGQVVDLENNMTVLNKLING